MALDIEFIPLVKFLVKIKKKNFGAIARKHNATAQDLVCLDVTSSKGLNIKFYMQNVGGKFNVYKDYADVPLENGRPKDINIYLQTVTSVINDIIRGTVDRPDPRTPSRMIKVPFGFYEAYVLGYVSGSIDPVRARQFFDGMDEVFDDARKTADEVLKEIEEEKVNGA